jgi:hypothetical protein
MLRTKKLWFVLIFLFIFYFYTTNHYLIEAKIFILIFSHYIAGLPQYIHSERDIQRVRQGQIEPTLSTIFKEKIVDTPQTFGSFVDDEGTKFCAVSALLRYLGYNITTSRKATLPKEIEGNNTNIELIPSDILERVENIVPHGNLLNYIPKCFCSKPEYYYYTLACLLIHLNDYHKMTFLEIGNWLESKGL